MSVWFTPSSHQLFRLKEYPQIGEGNVYADWSGSALPPRALLDGQAKFLTQRILGNPHSSHHPSSEAKKRVDDVRWRILYELDALKIPGGDEYDVIFTSNATAAIHLLNHLRWQGGELLLLSDNHNSVNGLRMMAKKEGAKVRYSRIQHDLTIDKVSLQLDLLLHHEGHETGPHVFAYPLKSNYSGIVHSVEWVKRAQQQGWMVLLDVASYLPNHRLSLKELDIYPDFIPMSFYKIFGFPTGLGALVVKKSVLRKWFDKRWFAGGSIMFVSTNSDFFMHEAQGHARYEDGTVSFMSIPMVGPGFEYINEVREAFPMRAHELAVSLRERLAAIPIGQRYIKIHTLANMVSDTVAFNVFENSRLIDPIKIEKLADEHHIWIRSGCLCNPGCNEAIFGYSAQSLEREVQAGAVFSDWETASQKITPQGSFGVLRASFGPPNNEDDVDKIATFFEKFVVDGKV